MKILIFYFSNTDNTRKGVQHLKDCLQEKGHSCEIGSILKDSNPSEQKFDLVGFASPVYHGYPAKRMMQFIESWSGFKQPIKAFTILSCCFRPFNIGEWGAREHFRACLEKRGAVAIAQFRFFAEASHPIIRKIFLGRMTSRYFAKMFGVGCPDDNELRRIEMFAYDLEQAFEKHQSACLDLLEYSRFRKWLSTFVVRKFVESMDRSVLTPSINEKLCTQCGSCIRRCPNQAINWQGAYPAYDSKTCVHCQKCINLCPSEATQYRSPIKPNRYSRAKQVKIGLRRSHRGSAIISKSLHL